MVDKITSLVLKEWPGVRDESCHSALLQLLVDSQTFVLLQAAYFIFNSSQYLRMCQDLSVFQRGVSQYLGFGYPEARPWGISF